MLGDQHMYIHVEVSMRKDHYCLAVQQCPTKCICLFLTTFDICGCVKIPIFDWSDIFPTTYLERLIICGYKAPPSLTSDCLVSAHTAELYMRNDTTMQRKHLSRDHSKEKTYFTHSFFKYVVTS